MKRACRRCAVTGAALLGLGSAGEARAQSIPLNNPAAVVAAPASAAGSFPQGNAAVGTASPAFVGGQLISSATSRAAYPVRGQAFPAGSQPLNGGPEPAQAQSTSGEDLTTPAPYSSAPAGPDNSGSPQAVSAPAPGGKGALGDYGAGGYGAGQYGAGGMGPGGAAAAPGTAAAMGAASEADIAGLSQELGQGAESAFTPIMIGDMSSFGFQGPYQSPLPGPTHLPVNASQALPPSVRNFKISENQSARPQDRFFFSFNFYTNVNSTVNSALKLPVKRITAYNEIWGFEKTFDQGNGSVGLRMPLDQVTAQSSSSGYRTPSSSALGNLDIYVKYILKEDRRTGSLFTSGFEITPQTSTTRFGGAPYMPSVSTTYLQPFIAYLWRRDKFYFMGFNGFDFSANTEIASFMYNDFAVGYFLLNNPGGLISAVVPAFEVHVNSPINHHNPFNRYDFAAMANNTDLTYGLNVKFGQRTVVTAALVSPVSYPKPFDAQFALLLNIFYGRTARQMAPPVTPPVQ